MKLKKPAKDHRGSWDLVLDNEGLTLASLRYKPHFDPFQAYFEILWPLPRTELGAFEWHCFGLAVGYTYTFLGGFGVDTAPLGKLIAEKLMAEKAVP